MRRSMDRTGAGSGEGDGEGRGVSLTADRSVVRPWVRDGMCGLYSVRCKLKSHSDSHVDVRLGFDLHQPWRQVGEHCASFPAGS